jgi:predicted RNase H-like nuclease (RuvC/YqgF family)
MMVMEKERENTNELEAAGDETEGLRQENRALTRELESRDAAIIRLEQVLAGKDSEIAALKQALDEVERKLTELGEALAQAVASYKALVVQANPGVLAELITGDTVEAVNESLKNARALVDRVRQEMEAEVLNARIPAGAPQRTPLDLSVLSPREKIQYAIGGHSS